MVNKRIDIYNRYKYKSFLQKYLEDKNSKYLSREIFIKNAFEDIVQELISHNILTNSKFNDINSVRKFTESYIIGEMVSGRLKLTSFEFNKLINSVNNIPNDSGLYSLICKENDIKYNSSRYNEVSKVYLNNYIA